ncbi:hypothetical protein CCACVL1_20018 [Corchorus capsularis]|uniref:Uncharacterized protein n=1 Tax=Corchorus capsularis TaxID=210143 RepID=A0A1R3HD23_COCAP|nr:hypothetical protein CCACVL1_20018 [Corchorus capsularis]
MAYRNKGESNIRSGRPKPAVGEAISTDVSVQSVSVSLTEYSLGSRSVVGTSFFLGSSFLCGFLQIVSANFKD